MSELIFGKNQTQRIVGIEPSSGNECTLFIQNESGEISTKIEPMTHWILFEDKLSPKFQELKGNQPFKYLMEYDNKKKFDEILYSTREKRLEHFICRDPKEAFMVKNGFTMYKGLKVKDVSVLSFDLEHTYGIGDTLNRNGKLLLISNTFRNSKGEIKKKLFAYDEFESEAHLLLEWCKFIRECDPSIIIGHNLFGHDFRVLRFAANKTRVRLNLGRDGSEIQFDRKPSKKRKDGSQAYDFFNVQIYGRDVVDTFFLALNFDIARNYESYGLKQIIKQENLDKPGRVYYDASKIIENYLIPEEWEKIKVYCVDDSDESLALFDLMIAPFFYATQSIPRSLQHVINSASGSQINAMMVRAYLQQGYSIAKADSAVEYEGAISFGIPGIHRNVLRFDVSSLYPSIIRQYRIYHPTKDPQELFLKMVEYFTLERLKNKKLGKETGDRYYKDLEQSQKILINSMYGFLGANRVNYNYPQGAADVTSHGRRILKQAIKWATGKEFELNQSSNEELEEQI